MSVAQAHHSDSGPFRGDYRSYFGRNHATLNSSAAAATTTSNQYYTFNSSRRNCANSLDFSKTSMEHSNYHDSVKTEVLPSLKRRKFSSSTWENCGRSYNQSSMYDNIPSSCTKISSRHPKISDANTHTSTTCKRDRTKFEDEDEDVVFMSRDEIERCSPSRKDGIDALQETRLRYSYCAFLQDLGLRVELPQTTIGTAMVLCHRFFVRRSHACHDRFLIATAALFLAAKSEETPCPLNNVLRASCEIFHKQDFNLLFYLLPVNWFEQYWERVIEAEQMILTTLNFELNVQHPYVPLTSILDKLGLTQTFLVNLALSLVSEGLRSSLWLQFKPNQIAAGAAYLAAKSLNMDLSSCQNVWQEFHTPPSVLKDVVQQLMELF